MFFPSFGLLTTFTVSDYFACFVFFSRAIARMIARTFLLIIGGKYLLGVGFCSCVFCFVFYLVRTKLVLLIFSTFFAAKNAHVAVAV